MELSPEDALKEFYDQFDKHIDPRFADAFPVVDTLPINKTLWKNAKLKFDLLSTYFYRPSYSPVASCLVVAAKATKPYAPLVNKYIAGGHPMFAKHCRR